ncbi:MAG TPA: hypothetical protein VF529_21920 [Solirubrobacteraceae bacterium]|jgi:hypothetical protein
MTLRSTLLAACAATLALAGTASADSISFVRGGDIWVASPDGSRQVQITHGGGYSYASQADDGTFIGLAGRRLHRIDRQGNVLADFATPVSGDVPNETSSYFMGPFDPEISPDGTKVVYTYYWQYIYRDPGCSGPDWLCTEEHLYQGVGYSRADAMTGWDEAPFGRQSGWVHPSWLTNDRVMTSAPSEPLNVAIKYDDVSPDNQDIQDWFTDEEVADMEDGEVNRQRSMVAFLDAGKADEAGKSRASRISFYRMTGDEPAVPERCFTLGYADGRYEGPSWAPSGDRVAVVDRSNADESGRLMVVSVPDLAGGCQTPASFWTKDNVAVTIDDARHPDWGPADVPSGSAADGPKPVDQPGKPTPGPQTPTPNNPVVGPVQPPKAGPTTRRMTLRGRALARALRGGLVVRFRAAAPGVVTVRALQGRKVVAQGSARAARPGTVAIRLRFTARAKRALRAKRSLKLTVRLTLA